MDNEKLDQCIDVLCHCGCDAVRNTIAAIEAGRPVPPIEGLTEGEKQKVLDELKSIMSVYDRK